MALFDEFYESLPEDSNKRGDYFEKVVIPWFLKTDPVWSTKVSQIWLWDEYPQPWGKDRRDDRDNKRGFLLHHATQGTNKLTTPVGQSNGDTSRSGAYGGGPSLTPDSPGPDKRSS